MVYKIMIWENANIIRRCAYMKTEPIWKWLLSYANRLWDYPHTFTVRNVHTYTVGLESKVEIVFFFLYMFNAWYDSQCHILIGWNGCQTNWMHLYVFRRDVRWCYTWNIYINHATWVTAILHLFIQLKYFKNENLLKMQLNAILSLSLRFLCRYNVNVL